MFLCKVCGKHFQIADSLLSHMDGLCGKTFKNQAEKDTYVKNTTEDLFYNFTSGDNNCKK